MVIARMKIEKKKKRYTGQYMYEQRLGQGIQKNKVEMEIIIIRAIKT